MKIILDQCDEDTRAKIALDPSYEDNMKTGDQIKFFLQVQKVCNNAKDKNVFFSSQLKTLPNINSANNDCQTNISHSFDG